MSLFAKDIESIEFDDVKAFFELNIREGLRVDYKSDFPSDLAKIIIALANTAGGIVLIGIRANVRTNKPEEIVGVELQTGIEERVVNISLSNIRPSMLPEIKVCPYKSQDNLSLADRAVVVIRIPPSELAPHIHLHDNKIWIRKHNRCDLASLETIEYLLEKRNRSPEIRKRISRNAQITIDKVINEMRRLDSRIRFQIIHIFPTYSMKKTAFDKPMDDFLRGQINSVGHTNTATPKPDGIEFRFRSSSDQKTLRFFSVDQFLSFLNIELLEIEEPGKVYIERVVQIAAKMLRAAIRVFEHLGYFGKLSIEITVRNVRGLEFQNMIPSTYFDVHHSCEIGSIEIQEFRSSNEIRTKETEILLSIYNKLLRSFKMSLETAVLQTRLDWLLRNLP